MTFADQLADFAAQNPAVAAALRGAGFGIAIAALLVQRLLPAGVGTFALSAGLGLGLLVSLYIPLPSDAVPVAALGLAALSAFLARRAAPGADRQDAVRAANVTAMLIWLALLNAWCIARGAGAGGWMLTTLGGSLMLAAACPQAAIGACAAATGTVVVALDGRAASWVPDLVALALGALSLLLLLWHILGGWRARKRQWIESPAMLTDRQPLRGGAIIVGIASLAGATALLAGGWSVWAVWLAAYACFGVAHVSRMSAAGPIGLILIAELVVLAVTRWFWGGVSGLLCGTLLASLLLLWFARFWRQQVSGEPWTTTGRLIPHARRLSIGLAAAALSVALAADPRGAVREELSVLGASFLVLIALGAWAQFGADARAGNSESRIGTIVALAAAGFTAHLALPGAWLHWSSPLLLLPAFTLLLAIRNRAAPQPLYRGFAMGVLPVMLLAGLAVAGYSAALLLAIVLTLAAAALA